MEEIYQQIKDVKIGLITVYQSLKLFEDLGVVEKIPMDEARIKNHSCIE
ncbi:MAG: transcriptional repressor [Mobilitalea sp.]